MNFKTIATCASSLGLGILIACGTMRDALFCQLNTQTGIASCARGDKKWEEPIANLDGYFATDEKTLRKIADKLEACEQASNPEAQEVE